MGITSISKKPNKDDSNHDVAHIRPHHTLNGFFSNFPQSFQSFITLGHCWHGWGRSWYWIGPDWNLSLQRFISDYPHFPDGIVSKTGIPKTWKKHETSIVDSWLRLVRTCSLKCCSIKIPEYNLDQVFGLSALVDCEQSLIFLCKVTTHES